MPDAHGPAPERGVYGSSGVDHYSSPDRRDAVKAEWEEPVTLAFLRRALARTAAWTDRPIVLDVGCGLGDGLDHLRRLRGEGSAIYRGLDTDADMVLAARERHAGVPDATFAGGDVRTHDWAEPVDLVHSCGVPWSHLSADELAAAVAAIATSAHEGGRRTVLTLDVLGRWSAEWPDRWEQARWEYVMSFFAGDGDPPTASMATWDGGALEDLVRSVGAEAGCRVDALERWDRAVGVGRHADSGQHPSLTAGLRGAVNRLAAGEDASPQDLLIGADDPPGLPEEPASTWRRHVLGWNALVGTALGEPGHVDAPALPDDDGALGVLRAWSTERELDPAASGDDGAARRRRARRLFEHLRAHEWRAQRGVGLGHTLMLCCVLDGRPAR